MFRESLVVAAGITEISLAACGGGAAAARSNALFLGRRHAGGRNMHRQLPRHLAGSRAGRRSAGAKRFHFCHAFRRKRHAMGLP